MSEPPEFDGDPEEESFFDWVDDMIEQEEAEAQFQRAPNSNPRNPLIFPRVLLYNRHIR